MANAMRAYRVPGVNHIGNFGRWAFAEFTSMGRSAPISRLLNKLSNISQEIGAVYVAFGIRGDAFRDA
jgi:hypothetical protein